MKSLARVLILILPFLLLSSPLYSQEPRQATPAKPDQANPGEGSARIFGIGPKFDVVQGEDPRPLRPRDKFRLFAADSTRPYQFLVAGAVTGISMTDPDNRGYGQGAEGFGKRFGAAMADEASSNFFGTFLFPSIFRQDPRYFRHATGTPGQRIGYAVSRVLVTRSDHGSNQFNISKVLGICFAAGLANAYYPQSERSVGRTFTTIGINFGTTAGLNVVKEFWRKKK